MLIRKSAFQPFLIIIFLSIIFSKPKIYCQSLRVGSYNLRYDNPEDSLDSWKYRKDAVTHLIRYHDFDIFGTQEGLHHMLEQMSEGLSDYRYIGVGREDGKQEGEYSAIFYKIDKFKLLEKGDFWLSEDPSEPNVGWDAVLPRICSWGKFEEKDSGFTFFFFNAHFDHIGVKAREESAKLILEQIGEIAEGMPVLLTGDFNVDEKSSSYKIINRSKRLTDTYDHADFKYGPDHTFNQFMINNSRNGRIDHIFTTDDFYVLKQGILTDTYFTDAKKLKSALETNEYPKSFSFYKGKAHLPSDHYPILTVLKY